VEKIPLFCDVKADIYIPLNARDGGLYFMTAKNNIYFLKMANGQKEILEALPKQNRSG